MSRDAHRPSMRALLAYEGGLLSEPGAARLERHLGACESCRRLLSSMRVYGRLAEEARAATPPPINWSRMEAAIAAEGRRQRFAGLGRFLSPGPIGATLGTMAAAALLLVALRGGPSEREHAARASVPRTVEDRPSNEISPRFVQGEVTAVAGSVRAGSSEAGAPLGIGAAVREGMWIETDAGAEVHVRAGDESGFVLAPNGRVELGRLREDEVRIGLSRGAISSAVAERKPSEELAIASGPWLVRVVGTLFRVSTEGEELAVDVEEGTVEILRDGEWVTTVAAPGRFHSGGSEEERAACARPRALSTKATSWPILRLPAPPEVAFWEVDGTPLPGSEGIATRVPRGEVTVLGFGADGKPLYRAMLLVEGELDLAEADLKRIKGDTQRQGTMDPAVLAPVLKEAGRAFQSCYERALRLEPDLHGVYTLHVTLGRSGVAQTAKLVAPEGPAPEVLVDCVVGEVRRRAFPAPSGGPVSFSVPLNFQHAR